MASHEKAFEEGFRRGWDKGVSKLTPEQQELIKKATPQQIAFAVFVFMLNPINWFKVIFAGIRGVFK